MPHHSVTGQNFKDPRPNADITTLGPNEWATLENLCGDDAMHLELVARLLDTERIDSAVQKAFSICKDANLRPKAFWGQTMSRRTGI